MKKRLLILGASHFQVPFIQLAQKIGAYVGVVDINKEAPGIAFADEYFHCSLLDKNAVLSAATRFNAEGITVGTCEVGVVTASYVAEKLGLPFFSQDVARKATNKIDMIEAFFKHGVAAPAYEVVRIGDNIKTNIPFPVITKPADKSASRGICFVNREEDLSQAVEMSMEASDSKEVLIEEYMDGIEFSVELGIEGQNPIALQITDKICNGAPHYIEIGQAQPLELPQDVLSAAKKLACDAATAVGLENCAGHAEIKWTSTGLKMVEIGGRMGGHFVDADLLESSTGYQLQEAVIRFALGENFVVKQKSPKGPTGMMCILSEEGTIKRITGVEDARQVPGIIKVVMSCKVGNTYHSGVSNNDLIGFVVARAESKNKALSVCNEALNRIIIEYE